MYFLWPNSILNFRYYFQRVATFYNANVILNKETVRKLALNYRTRPICNKPGTAKVGVISKAQEA